MAYALLVERQERLAVALVARGAEPGLLDEQLAAFDERLLAGLSGSSTTDPWLRQVHEVLGVR